MATESVATHRVPKALLTSENCIAIENAWDYSYGTRRTTFKKGDLMIVDLDRCPKRGDVVVMCRNGLQPFGRRCYLPPIQQDERKRWMMGVLDLDGETIHMFKLGEYNWSGVVTGKVAARKRRD